MAPVVTMRQLLEAGVHFGHQTRRWNPKMKRFIHSERNGIYIIDLQQTLGRIDTAYKFARDVVADGGEVLFIGTKRQVQGPVSSYADRSGSPYINERWLGGMLTNFQTISKRVAKMQEYEAMLAAGEFEAMPKKEALVKSRELAKLQRYLGGIRKMNRLPSAIFVLDTNEEKIAVVEANKLGIPVIAVVDTNCDPDMIDFVIPGNDDAIRAGNLMCRIISDAVIEGRRLREKRSKGGDEPSAADAPAPDAPAAEAPAAEAAPPAEPAAPAEAPAAEAPAPEAPAPTASDAPAPAPAEAPPVEEQASDDAAPASPPAADA